MAVCANRTVLRAARSLWAPVPPAPCAPCGRARGRRGERASPRRGGAQATSPRLGSHSRTDSPTRSSPSWSPEPRRLPSQRHPRPGTRPVPARCPSRAASAPPLAARAGCEAARGGSVSSTSGRSARFPRPFLSLPDASQTRQCFSRGEASRRPLVTLPSHGGSNRAYRPCSSPPHCVQGRTGTRSPPPSGSFFRKSVSHWDLVTATKVLQKEVMIPVRKAPGF